MDEQKSQHQGQSRAPADASHGRGPNRGTGSHWQGTAKVAAEPVQMGRNGLPAHIEARVARDGRTYYVNHRTQKTSWNLPPRQDW